MGETSVVLGRIAIRLTSRRAISWATSSPETSTEYVLHWYPPIEDIEKITLKTDIGRANRIFSRMAVLLRP